MIVMINNSFLEKISFETPTISYKISFSKLQCNYVFRRKRGRGRERVCVIVIFSYLNVEIVKYFLRSI